MLSPGPSPVIALANKLRASPDPEVARELVACVGGDCISELVARSGLAGHLTQDLFDVLADAWDAALAARELRGLPEAAA